MPLNAWPEQHRLAWQRAISPGTALLDAGAGAHWRPATRKRYCGSYGRWLASLSANGELNEAQGLGDIACPKLVLAYLEELETRGLARSSIASEAQALHNALWGMVPEHDWRWLRRIVNILTRNAPPRQTDPSRLHDIGTVYDATLAFMERAEGMPAKRPFQNALWFRDGLMVAVAAATVLRRRNLGTLEIGRHLRRQDRTWTIWVPGCEIKNGIAFEAVLPDSLGAYLSRYLEQHRPQLLQRHASARLWINQYGEDLSVHSLGPLVLRVTTRLGYPMMPHDFRRSAATSISELRPDLALTIGRLLGHATQHTSERYYNKAQMRLSSRRYGGEIEALRRDLGQTSPDR